MSPLQLTASQSGQLRPRYGRWKFAGSPLCITILWHACVVSNGLGGLDLSENRDSMGLEYSLI